MSKRIKLNSSSLAAAKKDIFIQQREFGEVIFYFKKNVINFFLGCEEADEFQTNFGTLFSRNFLSSEKHWRLIWVATLFGSLAEKYELFHSLLTGCPGEAGGRSYVQDICPSRL